MSEQPARPAFHLRYAAELAAASLVGWLLATRVITVYLDHLLAHDYGQYDWYDSFMGVISLICIFVSVGLSLAVTVQFRHPD